jgi:(p)ppGpp synthase/HD superfamily hydrolase
MSDSTLEAAIALAAYAHAGQIDKGGAPYILHPLRVMMACKGEKERIAAVLHDVVEDCGYEVTDLREQFGGTVSDAVDALTRRRSETYEAFIDRCAANPVARVVKLADIADNMDVRRLGREPTAEDNRRLLRYERARAVLFPTPCDPTADDRG